jgi:hypothetical protein
MAMEKGITYGQNEMASVPNASAKISETMYKGARRDARGR